MPFDGNPKQFETKPDVFSLEGLIAWLETQDPDERYCYSSIGDCLLHRYFTAAGVPVRTMGGESWTDTSGHSHPLPGSNVGATPGGPLNKVAVGGRETYGDALKRARELLSAQP